MLDKLHNWALVYLVEDLICNMISVYCRMAGSSTEFDQSLDHIGSPKDSLCLVNQAKKKGLEDD